VLRQVRLGGGQREDLGRRHGGIHAAREPQAPGGGQAQERNPLPAQRQQEHRRGQAPQPGARAGTLKGARDPRAGPAAHDRLELALGVQQQVEGPQPRAEAAGLQVVAAEKARAGRCPRQILWVERRLIELERQFERTALLGGRAGHAGRLEALDPQGGA
jgi:hypothetical protein